MLIIEKIRLRAEKCQRAQSSLFIAQRKSVKPLVFVGLEKRTHSRCGGFRFDEIAFFLKIDRNVFGLIRYPLQALTQVVHLSRFWNFRFARNGAENKTPTIKEANHAPVKRKDQCRLVDHCAEDAVQIQGGSDLLGNFQKRAEDLYFSLGLQEI